MSTVKNSASRPLSLSIAAYELKRFVLSCLIRPAPIFFVMYRSLLLDLDAQFFTVKRALHIYPSEYKRNPQVKNLFGKQNIFNFTTDFHFSGCLRCEICFWPVQ